MEKKDGKIYISWEDIERDVSILARHFDRNGKPDLIVGISRGGLIPAVMLSHKLGVPMKPLVWQTRDGDTKDYDVDLVDLLEEGKVVVFIDDINDTGKTFTQIEETYKVGDTVHFAAVYTRSDTIFTDVVTSETIEGPEWLILPWE